MALTDTLLTVGSDTLQLSSVEQATLTAGGSANTFSLGSFTGSAVVVGGAGNDDHVFGAGPSGSFFLDETEGGVDTIDLSARSAIEIILSSVEEQSVDSQLKITLSSINDFENVVGTPGADTITGNEADNVITGGAGDDTLEGDIGDDTYVLDDGWGTDTITEGSEGDGIDSINFTAVASNVNVTIAADGKFTFGDGTNTVAFDNVEVLHGGTGVNTLDFALSDRAVVVDISGGTSTDFETLSGFDNVVGSPFGDTIIGNDRANHFEGGAGNDQLSGGKGADLLDGGPGIDTLIESRDVNYTLTNTQLTATGTGIVGSEVNALRHRDRVAHRRREHQHARRRRLPHDRAEHAACPFESRRRCERRRERPQDPAHERNIRQRGPDGCDDDR